MEFTQLPILAIVAGAALYLGAYLGKRGEQRALKETLDYLKRREADISEAAKVRWSKRSEVIAGVYGRISKVIRAWRFFFSSATTPSESDCEEARAAFRSLDGYFAETALYLPHEI